MEGLKVSSQSKLLLSVLLALLAGYGVINGLIIPPEEFSGFDMAPPSARSLSVFETPWLYAILHVFSFFPVLVLSFDRRVHYYTYWRYLFPSIFIIGAAFIVWDAIFTDWQIWGFNPMYITGHEVFGLPFEEVLFFFTVPFACLFIYECLNAYVKRDLLGNHEKEITIGLIVGLSVLGFAFFDKIYTATTFFLTAGFLLWHLVFQPGVWRGRFYLAWLVSWIPFLLVDGALTGSFTVEPVVLYHPPEFSGWRILSIPIEDSIYSLLLLMSVTTIYEYLKKRHREEFESSSEKN